MTGDEPCAPVFFFQAEDGIRDHCVTGVQTCALPILAQHPDGPLVQSLPRSGAVNAAQILAELGDDRARFQIGRASCRERVEIAVATGSGKAKTTGTTLR